MKKIRLVCKKTSQQEGNPSNLRSIPITVDRQQGIGQISSWLMRSFQIVLVRTQLQLGLSHGQADRLLTWYYLQAETQPRQPGREREAMTTWKRVWVMIEFQAKKDLGLSMVEGQMSLPTYQPTQKSVNKSIVPIAVFLVPLSWYLFFQTARILLSFQRRVRRVLCI